MTPANRSSAPSPSLKLPGAQGEEKIAAQIAAGRELLLMLDDPDHSLSQVQRKHKTWHLKNTNMLRGLFDPPDEMLREYESATPSPVFLRSRAPMAVPPPPGKPEREEATTIQERIDALDVIKDAVQYCTEEQGRPQARHTDRETSTSRDVFVVHGHDDQAKLSVARFIEQLELRAVILHEQPSRGRTIIEKVEDYADVRFAVVLLTPDDVCSPATEPEQKKPRARQNVIFELGFFVGKLGRERVCVLYKRGVEIPSDYDGVVFVEMDDKGAWRLELGKEMQEAGLSVDLNLVS